MLTYSIHDGNRARNSLLIGVDSTENERRKKYSNTNKQIEK